MRIPAVKSFQRPLKLRGGKNTVLLLIHKKMTGLYLNGVKLKYLGVSIIEQQKVVL